MLPGVCQANYQNPTGVKDPIERKLMQLLYATPSGFLIK
jgi:hypothetical protein